MARDIKDIRSDFIEKIGMQSQADGLPRIAGRLLGLLTWDGEAVAFSDLADQLQVSRGSISTASRILEERHLIKRISKPGQRQDYFQLSDNPYTKMIEVISAGINRSQDEIQTILHEVPATETAIKNRVGAYSDFYTALSAAMTKLAEDMK